MEIKEIISKVRFKLGDTDETKFSNWQIMEALNEGNAFFRKTCLQQNPDLISKISCGTLEEKHNMICIPSGTVKVTCVRCDGRKLHASVSGQITDIMQTGSPSYYYAKSFGGMVRLFVFPVPSSEVEYNVEYVEEVEDLQEDDSLDIPREYINLLIDYIVRRLTGGAAEAFMELSTGLTTLINGLLPGACVVDGYY